jgi:signal transduction histidine kinase
VLDKSHTQDKSSAEGNARRIHERLTLCEVCREISAQLDLPQVLRSITVKACELLAGDVASLCLLDETEQTLDLHAASGLATAFCGTRSPVTASPASQILASSQALVCGADGCLGECRIIAAPFRRSQLAAPLRVEGRVIGALCVGSSSPQKFTAGAVDLLTKLAASAAVALKNARLYEQAERAAMLEERQRIAATMHDGLAQTLNYLKLKVEQATDLVEAGSQQGALAELQHMHVALNQATQDVRRAIASLRETPQPPQTLADRLTTMMSEFDGNSATPIELLVRLPEPLVLPAEQAEHALYVVREALLNANRHAQAGHITVCLERQGLEVVATVTDDGQGFNPEALPTNGTGHFGLSIMRARAGRIGGQLTIHSTPGAGTQVSLAWPG